VTDKQASYARWIGIAILVLSHFGYTVQRFAGVEADTRLNKVTIELHAIETNRRLGRIETTTDDIWNKLK